MSTKIKAILQALLVTLLWSSSFVIIKIGLDEIPPLLFAGLRYSIAVLFLLPLLFKDRHKAEIKKLNKRDWFSLVLLGLVFYTFTQGAQFLGLSLLPSVTVSLMLNFTPIVVAIMAIFTLKEIPSKLQWFGISLFVVGVLTYFFPVELEGALLSGIIVMTFGVFANAGAAVIGRAVNRSEKHSPIVITGISMSIGGIILLISGISMDGIPSISLINILLLLWMAGINTAFAFTLWNNTLRSLSAMESSIINGTMLIQIGLLAWIFLGESIDLKELIGMLIAAVGAVLVQLKKARSS